MSCAPGRQLVHLFEIAIFRHLPAVSHMLHDADGIRFDDAHWRIRLQQHAHDGRFGHGFADTRFDCTVRLTAHRRFRKARPSWEKMREIRLLRPRTGPPNEGSNPSRRARSPSHFDVIVRDTHGRIHGHIAAFRMPAEHDRGRIADERKHSDLSRIEFTYRYADSWDGTGQRTAILKSSFHPTSVPSVPRKATYSESTGPQPTSNVIAANCCCSRSLRRSAYSPTRNARKRGDSQTARSNASRYSFISEEFETNMSS